MPSNFRYILFLQWCPQQDIITMNKRSRNNYSQIQRKGIFTFSQTKSQKKEKSFNRVSLKQLPK